MNRSDALKGERVMNFFASLLVFFAGLLLIYIFSAIIRLVTRGRGGLLAGILPMLLVVVIGAGLSFYLDNNGDIVSGTVEAKNEQIVTYDTGTYNRYLDLDVRFVPSGTTVATTIRMPVDGALFDQLHNGSTVQVRYVNPAQLFIFSRLKQQTTLSLIPWGTMWPIFLAISLIAMIFFWFRKPRPRPDAVVEPGSEPVAPRNHLRPFIFILFICWLGAVLFTLFQPALMPVSSNNWQTTNAQVKAVRRYSEVTQSNRSSRTIPLIQPFDMVQFTFVPQGLSDPIVGVDVIDTTALTLPEQGTSLTIKYPVDNPRAAVITNVTRTHLWKNPLGALALSVGTILAVSLFWFMLRLGWKVLTRGMVGALARR